MHRTETNGKTKGEWVETTERKEVWIYDDLCVLFVNLYLTYLYIFTLLALLPIIVLACTACSTCPFSSIVGAARATRAHPDLIVEVQGSARRDSG